MRRLTTSRFIIGLLVYVAGVANGFGEEIISRSSDGRYQVRPTYGADAHDGGLKWFHLSVFDTNARRTIFVSQAVYDTRHGTDGLVLWHPSLSILALQVRAGRRFSYTELYSIKGRHVEALNVPDYHKIVLAKVGAGHSYHAMSDDFDAWHGNDLRLNLDYNVSKPDTHEYGGSYVAQVTLRVQHGKTSPVVKLKKLSVKPF